MPATTLQPEAKPETLVMVVYPSIAAGWLGCQMGRILDSVPMPFVKNVKLSALILGLPLAPVGLLLYILGKVVGERYVLTNHSLQIWSAIGNRLIGRVDMSQIADVDVEQRNGQQFYHAADLLILDAGDNTILTLEGVPRAEVFRQTILKTRDAHQLVEEALATIGARSGA